MAGSEKAARCNAEPPDLDAPEALLRYLLKIEFERLQTAVRIEQERDIVFPETTIIIRDIQKLQIALEEKTMGMVAPEGDDADREPGNGDALPGLLVGLSGGE